MIEPWTTSTFRGQREKEESEKRMEMEQHRVGGLGQNIQEKVASGSQVKKMFQGGGSNILSVADDMSSEMRTDTISNMEGISNLNKSCFGPMVGTKT